MEKYKVKFEIRLSGEIEVEAEEAGHAIRILEESDAYPLLDERVRDTKVIYKTVTPV